MNKQDHDELLTYLEELIRQASKVRCSYDWFMESEYMKLCNDTFSELIVADAINSGT